MEVTQGCKHHQTTISPHQTNHATQTHAPRHRRARLVIDALRVGVRVVGGAVGDDGGEPGHLPLVDVPVVEEELPRGGVDLWVLCVGVSMWMTMHASYPARRPSPIHIPIHTIYLGRDHLVEPAVHKLRVLRDGVGVPGRDLVGVLGERHEEAVALERLDRRGGLVRERLLRLLDVVPLWRFEAVVGLGRLRWGGSVQTRSIDGRRHAPSWRRPSSRS